MGYGIYRRNPESLLDWCKSPSPSQGHHKCATKHICIIQRGGVAGARRCAGLPVPLQALRLDSFDDRAWLEQGPVMGGSGRWGQDPARSCTAHNSSGLLRSVPP